MRRFFGKIIDHRLQLDDEELNHLAVLRLGEGDQFIAICGDEYEYVCQIKSVDKKHIDYEIISKNLCQQNPKYDITLFQAVPKPEKLEIITQKITELGAKNLVLFENEYCAFKPSANKLLRLNKITVESCKQCQRSIPVKIHDVVSFDDMLNMLDDYDVVLFAYEGQKNIENIDFKGAKRVAIIVGSEGGFSEAEAKKIFEKNAISMGLGKRILRCETAAIMSVGLISYKLDN